MTTEIWVAIIASFAAIASSAVAAFIAWRKWPTERAATEGDLAAKLAGAAAELVDDFRQEVAALRVKIGELEEREQQQAGQIRAQQEQIELLRADLLAAQGQIRKLEQENKKLRKKNAELARDIVRLEGVRNGE